MSTSANARNTAENGRRPPTTSGAKFRTASSRAAARDRTLSSEEVIPEDSASNGPHRGSASGAQKANGSTVFTERQTGRVQSSSRDILQVRTRSPMKNSGGGSIEERGSKDRMSTRQGSRTAEGPALMPKKEKKALRELYLDLSGQALMVLRLIIGFL